MDTPKVDHVSLAMHAPIVNALPDILPVALREALAEVGRKLESGSKLGSELDTALVLLAELPPSQIGSADRAIATAASLYHRPKQSIIGSLLSPRPSDAEQLLSTPGLEYLFLFHRDGRLREAALLKVSGGLPGPFMLAAVLWRLNDWVAQVREAAVRCASRSFPATNPIIAARTATALLVRQLSWGRWKDEQAVLDELFARSDVAERLADTLRQDVTGPLATVLRYALRTPALDVHLPRIAFEAVQPSVRAVALDSLINCKAEWPSGYAWQWIDKSMGLRRKVTVFAHRVINDAPPREELITFGAKDRSAAVRRVALTGIIRYLSGTSFGEEYATKLLVDRSPSVRERAKFILRREQL